MAVVAVPGVAQVTIRGKIGAQPWATVMHWRDGILTTPWSNASIIALVASNASAITTHLRASMCTNVNITDILVVDLSPASGGSAAYTGAAIVGTAPATLEPSSLCNAVAYKTGERYRDGHPRGYWPLGAASDMADESHWTGAHCTFIAGKISDFVNAVETAQIA